jgi:Undecaprenyl-phosphate galactose phosphotransferase WbaP
MSPVLPLAVRTRPLRVVSVLLVSDLLMLAAAGAIAIYGRWWLGGLYHPAEYLIHWPLLGVFLAAYACCKLYPNLPLSPAGELRQLSIVTSLIFLGLGTMTFLSQTGIAVSRGVLLIGWASALVLVPMGRAVVRTTLSSRAWWGYPVVVLGAGKTAAKVIRLMQRQPELGLKPVAVLDDDVHSHQRELLGVPVVGKLDMIEALGRQHDVPYALLAQSDIDPSRLDALIDRFDRIFSHLAVIPPLNRFSSLWVSPVDFGGVLGLEVRHRLMDPGRMMLKRLVDIGLVWLFSPLLFLLIGLIAILIKLDDPNGPAFYSQMRIGEGGRKFKVWKFRTMRRSADRILRRYLRQHPELRAEWEQTHKLRVDPRITRMGWLLRRTSLDELPQLWNVVLGQMSLVGPRPIVDDEVKHYGREFELFKKTKPGITGLWQVSGRNNLSYAERVALDVYYVRNWSVWLDLYLLSRTVFAVLFCRGAY